VAHILRVQYHQESEEAVPVAIPVVPITEREDRPSLHGICKGYMMDGEACWVDTETKLYWATTLFRVGSSPADLCNGFQLLNFENC
jgi:hypothetical protein